MKLGLYKHYKGKHYQVIAECLHSETLEEMIFYQSLYDNEVSKLWVRPKKMFLESVMFDGELVPRFKYIGDQKSNQRL